jgi:hypothetical protein
MEGTAPLALYERQSPDGGTRFPAREKEDESPNARHALESACHPS